MSAVAQELSAIVKESDPNLLMPYLYCTLALYAVHSLGGRSGNLIPTLRSVTS